MSILRPNDTGPFGRSLITVLAALALGGCVAVPADDYYYADDDYYYGGRDTVIVTPPPRVEYRGYPPAPSYIWIDGYWDWTGHRHEWRPGRWAPPGTHIVRPPIRHHDHDRDGRRDWDRDGRRDHDRDRDGRRDWDRDRNRDHERYDWRDWDRNRDGKPDRDGRSRFNDGRDRDDKRDHDRRGDRGHDRGRPAFAGERDAPAAFDRHPGAAPRGGNTLVPARRDGPRPEGGRPDRGGDQRNTVRRAPSAGGGDAGAGRGNEERRGPRQNPQPGGYFSDQR